METTQGSFRGSAIFISSSHSKRVHQIYKSSDAEVAIFMGHNVPVHNLTYAQLRTESIFESSMERALKFRDITSE